MEWWWSFRLYRYVLGFMIWSVFKSFEFRNCFGSTRSLKSTFVIGIGFWLRAKSPCCKAVSSTWCVFFKQVTRSRTERSRFNSLLDIHNRAERLETSRRERRQQWPKLPSIKIQLGAFSAALINIYAKSHMFTGDRRNFPRQFINDFATVAAC